MWLQVTVIVVASVCSLANVMKWQQDGPTQPQPDADSNGEQQLRMLRQRLDQVLSEITPEPGPAFWDVSAITQNRLLKIT